MWRRARDIESLLPAPPLRRNAIQPVARRRLSMKRRPRRINCSLSARSASISIQLFQPDESLRFSMWRRPRRIASRLRENALENWRHAIHPRTTPFALKVTSAFLILLRPACLECHACRQHASALPSIPRCRIANAFCSVVHADPRQLSSSRNASSH